MQIPITEIYVETESKSQVSENTLKIEGEKPPPLMTRNRTVRFIPVAAGGILLAVGIFAWNLQRKSAEPKFPFQNQVAQTTDGPFPFPKTSRQEIRSPEDEEAVKRVVQESQMLETLTFYSHPEKFEAEQLKKYWLPTTQGGKAAKAVEDSVNRMLGKKQHYGSESKNEKFEFRYVRIFSPRDYAEVGTIETWFVPRYNEDGSQVLNRNVRLGPYTVDYTLKKVDEVWLLEENSTPRAGQTVIPSPTPAAQ